MKVIVRALSHFIRRDIVFGGHSQKKLVLTKMGVGLSGNAIDQCNTLKGWLQIRPAPLSYRQRGRSDMNKRGWSASHRTKEGIGHLTCWSVVTAATRRPLKPSLRPNPTDPGDAADLSKPQGSLFLYSSKGEIYKIASRKHSRARGFSQLSEISYILPPNPGFYAFITLGNILSDFNEKNSIKNCG
jgi:hypothetical protein